MTLRAPAGSCNRYVAHMDAAATREVTIDAPVEEVWSALVDDEVRAGWLGDDGADRPLRLDDAIAPERITWTWWPAGDGRDGDGLASTVTITLRPHDDGTTRLRVVERLASSAWALARAGAGATAAAGGAGPVGVSFPAATAAIWAERLLALELWLLLAPARV